MKYGAIAIFSVTLLVVVVIIIFFMSPSLVLAGSYEKSQVISQSNECGNYWFPVNVICSNLNSQAEGDENNIAPTTTAIVPNTESDSNFGPPFP
jgi:flagellar basal body-associated protein FliL